MTMPNTNYLMYTINEPSSRYPECWWLIAVLQDKQYGVLTPTTEEFVEWDTLTITSGSYIW